MPPARRGPTPKAGYLPAEVVEVRAWDQTVGAVVRDPATGFYAFEYDPAWVRTGIELAPLHMPAKAGVTYEFVGLPEHTYYRLPALLADALPDAFGNALVNAWMADHGVDPGHITPLDRLAYAADRSIGALQFRPPARDEDEPVTAVQLADLVVAARDIVRGDFSKAETLQSSLQQLIQVGTSAGGARAKAVLAYNEETGQVRSGQADAPPGFTHWIVKLDGVGEAASGVSLDGRSDRLGAGAPYGIIEYAYYLMATAAGVQMSECRLLPEGPRTHFMTRRFDRGHDATGRPQRHHVQSLCALDHLDFRLVGTHSYAQLFSVIERLGIGADDREQAFRRMVFNVAAANRDDHTKNVAFLLPQGQRAWELSPAFDVTYAYNPLGEWTQRHQLSVNGKFDGIEIADLHAVGEQFSVPGYKQVVREVLEVVSGWTDFAGAAGLDLASTGAIAGDLTAMRPA